MFSDTCDNPASRETVRHRLTHGRLDSFTALRLQRGAEHLHRLGPRATAELLAEVAARIGGLPAVLGLLVEYERRLSPAMVRAAGGDRFPAPRLRVVP